ncbi:MAG: chromosome segregation protein SMC [Candidatus Omnitrophica bacterium]|nr:chromosome segregation protein SMC [Candidatus Omnitrophota bacterium]
MRFKKLELLGFKSFAEPTELLFEPGVTAIVGPNGGGKSNLADSIKWVLGEQSARELRGGRMEDLIFNGSESRDPINYAEVSLTLDNADKTLPIEYTDVTIARRLYRSGESEYLLNGTTVRLKDIQQLLMGTGVGTSAYSLFEQGRIEQIISARPEDRRAIFEEAAGITKFKSQKREALRKLDETESNLARVSDVVAEIKRQIQSLERAVRRAKAYQEQFEQLKKMEVRVALSAQTELTKQLEAKEEALKGIQDRLAGIEQELAGQESRLGEERQAVAQADQDLAQARESYLGVTHRQETIRHRLEVAAERITESRTRREQLIQEMDAAEEQIRQLKTNQQELSAVLAQAQAQRSGKEDHLLRIQKQLEECANRIGQAEIWIADAQDRLLEETASQVRVKNELNRIHQEATRMEARHSRLQIEGSKVSGERTEGSSQVQELEQAFAQAKEGVDQLVQERAQRRDQLTGTEKTLVQIKQKVAGLEQESTKLNSQLELLKGLLESHEGYSSGVRELLAAFDQGRLSKEGVSGVLAELIRVKEEETAAVDAALGSFAQGVVVESAPVAERCRQYLEQSKSGRVLFLIRDRVPGQPAGERNDLGNSAVALIDRIGITPHLEPLLRMLLSDTWLVPDRAAAETFLDKRGQPIFNSLSRFVTPAGELYSPVSALLGSVSPEGLVVGRASRLQSLEVATAHLETQLDEARGQLGRAEQEYQVQRQVIGSLEETLQERSHQLQGIQATLSSARASLSKLELEQELLRTEYEQANAELEQIRGEAGRMEKELAVKDQGLAQLEGRIGQAQEQIAQAVREREEISVVQARLKAEMASFDQVMESRRSSLRLLEQTLEGSLAQLEASRSELARLEESKKQCEAVQMALEAGLEASAQEEIGAKGKVAVADERKAKTLSAARAQERNWLVLSRQVEQLQSQLHQHQMEQAQVNFQSEQIHSRLNQVYQVNLEELPPDQQAPAAEEELAGLQEKIQELSQKLQRMGPVNLGSIDEERELQTRYEQMVSQQNDLLKAKENLHEAITKINRTTRAMFRETFEAIQKEFHVTFKQLFGGGEARLVLLDEEDLLESGIEIIARPPGKPVQAISLLSGGEKTLTSIALLFAIFRVKPSPFCLMDEIDAALDETNIGRFTNALKEFLKDSQFIIITHNKKTITMADVMYGITMAESGVSKIVSVKLKESANGSGNGNGAHHLVPAAANGSSS